MVDMLQKTYDASTPMAMIAIHALPCKNDSTVSWWNALVLLTWY